MDLLGVVGLGLLVVMEGLVVDLVDLEGLVVFAQVDMVDQVQAGIIV